FSQVVNCIQRSSALDADPTDALASPRTMIRSAASDAQGLPFSSPVPQLALHTLITENFPGPTEELDVDSSQRAGSYLYLASDTAPGGESSLPIPMMATLLGIGICGLAFAFSIRKYRRQSQNELGGLRTSGPTGAAPANAPAEESVPEAAEDILQASTRWCRHCTSALVRPSRARNIIERRLLPHLSIIPVRCLSCRRRYYAMAFVPWRDAQVHVPDTARPRTSVR
ncbi:MAG: hypothetical protein ACRD2O_17515, partial [Terriglobia bacterium]